MDHTAQVIPFPGVPAGSRDHRIPRQRVFYLGYHEYSAGPGLCWHTEYWLRRLRKGEAWELFGTMPDVSGRQRISMGEHTSDEAHEYFESVNFEITNAEWYAMGWRSPEGAEIIRIVGTEIHGTPIRALFRF